MKYIVGRVEGVEQPVRLQHLQGGNYCEGNR